MPAYLILDPLSHGQAAVVRGDVPVKAVLDGTCGPTSISDLKLHTYCQIHGVLWLRQECGRVLLLGTDRAYAGIGVVKKPQAQPLITHRPVQQIQVNADSQVDMLLVDKALGGNIVLDPQLPDQAMGDLGPPFSVYVLELRFTMPAFVGLLMIHHPQVEPSHPRGWPGRVLDWKCFTTPVVINQLSDLPASLSVRLLV
ncbi:hypothetical protein EFK68_02580 [Pseudomonas aeruginosa]|nr:hypothetical protein EFK68_02580 [Pseudomonas aeruginosa]